jgi:hypothetical protein
VDDIERVHRLRAAMEIVRLVLVLIASAFIAWCFLR